MVMTNPIQFAILRLQYHNNEEDGAWFIKLYRTINNKQTTHKQYRFQNGVAHIQLLLYYRDESILTVKYRIPENTIKVLSDKIIKIQ